MRLVSSMYHETSLKRLQVLHLFMETQSPNINSTFRRRILKKGEIANVVITKVNTKVT